MRNRLLIFLLLLSSLAQGQIQFRFGNGKMNALQARNNLINFTNGFTTTVANAESGTLPQPFDVYGGADPSGVASISRSSSFSKFGSSSYQFIVNKTDAQVANGRRAEVNQFDDNNGVGYTGYERWVGFNIFIPTGWTYETNNVLYYIFQQFHDYETGAETGYKSAFEFLLDKDRWAFTVRACDNETSTSFYEVLGTDSSFSPTTNPTWGLSNPLVTKNVWHDIVIHLVFQNPVVTNPNRNSARIEIWVDGVKCVNYTGKMGFNHAQPPFFKIGNYAWMWNDDNLACCGDFTVVTSRTHYCDNIRIGNASATFNDVNPAVP